MKKEIAPFDGFSKSTLHFFEELAQNNTKEWFDENRAIYELEVKARAESFVIAMGEKLIELSPTINAEPRVNRSIFKINRDIRFSKDKTPYKAHLAIIFWDGGGRMESPSFYFHLGAQELMLGVGLYSFDKKILDEYRKSIVHPKHGAEFHQIVQKLKKKGFEVSGKKYKKTPRGFDNEHPYAEYLLHGGVYTGVSIKPPKELYSKKLVSFCFRQYKDFLELEQWLVKLVKRAQK